MANSSLAAIRADVAKWRQVLLLHPVNVIHFPVLLSGWRQDLLNIDDKPMPPVLVEVGPPVPPGEAPAMPLQEAVGICDNLLQWCDAALRPAAAPSVGSKLAAPEDETAWVPAGTLWHDHFTTIKEVNNFRKDHPDMFRNPCQFKLEIHSGKWATHWAKRDKAGFDALDGDLASIADDPGVQDEALIGAAQRMAEVRKRKKKAGKQ